MRSDVGQMCLKRTNEISPSVIYERKKSAGADHRATDGSNADDSNYSAVVYLMNSRTTYTMIIPRVT